jgi:hypothetical protein
MTPEIKKIPHVVKSKPFVKDDTQYIKYPVEYK